MSNALHKKKAVPDRIIDWLLGHTRDYYLCFLPGRLGRISSMILGFFYSRIKLDPEQKEKIIELSKEGVIVYVNRHKSNFEYLFLHTRYKKENLPFPEIGFDYHIWFWQPFSRILRMLLSKTVFWVRHHRFANAYTDGYIGKEIANGRAAMLSLVDEKGFTRRFVEAKTDPVEYLINLQAGMDKPVFLVPNLMFFSRNPLRSKPDIFDLLFGTEEKPGRIRRLVTLVRYYGRVSVEVSEPLNLKSFLSVPGIQNLSILEQGLLIRRSLILQLDRHRQSVTGPMVRSRVELKESILTSTRLRKFMQNYAEKENIPVFKVYKKAEAYLEEIAAKQSKTVLDLFAGTLTWIFHAMFDGVSFNMNELKRVKQLAQKGTIIYVPCHKSHIDYLVLSYLLNRNQLPCPHIAAGKNLSFWPLGVLFRSSGAFFLRRSFKGKELYTKVFSEYIYRLVDEGSSIEFFVEGGRSRSGKLLRPKLGFLSILIDALKHGRSNDLIFIPTFIGYDRVIEEGAHVHEVEGGQKKKETFSQVLGARKFLKQRFGKIYIRFHDPLYLSSLLKDNGLLLGDIKLKKQMQFAQNIGYTILNAIDKVTVVTPQALIASAVLNCSKHKFAYCLVIAHVKSYMSYLKAQQVELAETLVRDHEYAVKQVMEYYLNQKLIERVSGDDAGHLTNCEFRVSENRRALLEYYKNSCIAYFIPPAMTALSILAVDSFRFTSGSLHENYRLLQKLFKKEFAYNAEYAPEFLVRKSIKAFINDEIVHPHPTLPDTYTLMPSGLHRLKYYAGFLKSYFESYLIVLNYFSGKQKKKAIEPAERIKKIQALGNQMYKRGEIELPESLSKANYKNAVEFYHRRGIADSHDEQKIKYYMDMIRLNIKHLEG
jgi:glycerol-3-phosphate O-acyltransferase